MAFNDIIGKRMKEYYENIPKTKLMRRCPVAIRIDGKAFHTFTRNFNKPFDNVLMKSMQETTKYLCENVQGCVFGYTQSDEITLILIDYQTLDTDAFFDYETQKLCSIIASMATMKFNQVFRNNVNTYLFDIGELGNISEFLSPLSKAYLKAIENGAMFDCRCFNIPKEEVCNLIYWRQLDATRNSIQMVAQTNFSHKELEGKSCNEIQNMLFTQKNINWNDLHTTYKRGTACKKVRQDNNLFKWEIDYDIPIFKDENRKYINDLIYVGE